jgi:ferredoxin--NADP+ reductase
MTRCCRASGIWFFATGTGFAPFASLLREPQTYEDYDEVIITHTCREAGELTYGRPLIEADPQATSCWPN